MISMVMEGLALEECFFGRMGLLGVFKAEEPGCPEAPAGMGGSFGMAASFPSIKDFFIHLFSIG